MLPVSQDCPFLIARSVFSNVCCPRFVSCVPYVASVSGLSISDCILCNLYCLFFLTCVLCTLCYQFLRIVHFWLLVRYSLMFFVLDLCPVHPMLPVSLDCPFLIARSVFSNVCCPWLVSCVPYVTSLSGLSISDCSQGKQTLENTQGAIRNGQSWDTGNIGYTGHKSRTTNIR
jgi:hypothetical protein